MKKYGTVVLTMFLAVLPAVNAPAGQQTTPDTSQVLDSLRMGAFLSRVQDKIPSKPSLSTGKAAGSVLAGAAVGVGLGVLGGHIGAALANCGQSSEFLCGLGEALLGATAGYVVGSASGAYIIGGTGRDVTGSFKAAVGGSVVGLVSGILLTVIDERLFPSLFIGPPVVATFALNTSLRYRSSQPIRVGVSPYRHGGIVFSTSVAF